MGERGPEQARRLVESISCEVLRFNPEDRGGVGRLLVSIEELASLLADAGMPRERAVVLRGWKALRGLLDGVFDSADEALALVGRALADVEPMLGVGPPTAAAPMGTAEPEPEPDRAPAPEPGAGGDPTPAEQPASGEPSWDDDLLELMDEFLVETAEGLAACDEVLLRFEGSGPDGDGVDTLFRAFHTIKGTAGFLDLADVGTLAHRIESLLAQVRDGAREMSARGIDLLFDGVEVLRDHLDAAAEARSRGAPPARLPSFEPLLGRLGACCSEMSTTLPVVGELPSGGADAGGGGRDARGGPPRETVRVDLARVDELVELIGELVVAEAMVSNDPSIAALPQHRVRGLLGQLDKLSRDLQSIGMRLRMVPLRGTFQRVARMVRDTARKSGKQVRVVVSGEETEMDRRMVEELADPLVHMVRNAVDHGIEAGHVRRARGKPEVGVVHLRAVHEGSHVVIELSDDGKGLDRAVILDRARERGLVHEGAALPDEEVFALLFRPGFSTARRVTELSGRGVGMDVVRSRVEAMRGRVAIRSTPGQGTTFRLVLPLTTAIIDGMLVRLGSERYVLPTLSIVESIQPRPDLVATIGGDRELLDLRGELLPLFRLDRLLGTDGAEGDPARALAVIVETSAGRVALLVDELLTRRQLVIKSLGDSVGASRFVSGAAVLADGRVGVILDVDELVRAARAGVPPSAAAPADSRRSPPTSPPTRSAAAACRPAPGSAP